MRIQLDLPESKVTELKELMAETQLDTYKDLFNNALTLFEWAINEVQTGRKIASLDEENERYKVLAMPVLDSLGKRAKKTLASMR